MLVRFCCSRVGTQVRMDSNRTPVEAPSTDSNKTFYIGADDSRRTSVSHTAPNTPPRKFSTASSSSGNSWLNRRRKSSTLRTAAIKHDPPLPADRFTSTASDNTAEQHQQAEQLSQYLNSIDSRASRVDEGEFDDDDDDDEDPVESDAAEDAWKRSTGLQCPDVASNACESHEIVFSSGLRGLNVHYSTFEVPPPRMFVFLLKKVFCNWEPFIC